MAKCNVITCFSNEGVSRNVKDRILVFRKYFKKLRQVKNVICGVHLGSNLRKPREKNLLREKSRLYSVQRPSTDFGTIKGYRYGVYLEGISHFICGLPKS